MTTLTPLAIGGKPQRVVMLVHGHPDYSTGGSEMAAYSLFSGLLEAGCDAHLISWLSARRAPGLYDGRRLIQVAGSDREWAYVTKGSDPVFQDSEEGASSLRELTDYIVELSPQVIHLHHYLGFGADLIGLLRQRLPQTRIIFTIHEFVSLCLRDGQMLTRPANALCDKPTPIRCSGCFPELSRETIWMRGTWLRSQLDQVDAYTCPSDFVARRHVGWGLDPSRMHVIENAQICTRALVPPSVREAGAAMRFAFFGQINRYKGVSTLLKAVASLRTQTTAAFHVNIHGVLPAHDPEFAEIVTRQLDAAGSDVTFRGPYEAGAVTGLMSQCDYVVVPSIWWENSPVVIEEAFHAGKPVVCSGIGGMREKVQDGVNGLHFDVASSEALAEVLLRCVAEGPPLQSRLAAGVRKLPTLAGSAEAYLRLYASVPKRQSRCDPAVAALPD